MMDRTVKASSRMGLYLLGSLILSGLWARLQGKRRGGASTVADA